jgi:hypothetical protein
MAGGDIDPTTLALDELRELRTKLQHDDDVVSYVRRLAQGKLDLVRAQLRRLAASESGPITEELPVILAHNISGGQARPPRPAADFSDHPLATELDDLDDRMGGGHIDAMDAAALTEYADALETFEHARSHERKDLFVRIDALSAELVRRYRDGEADVDGLLANE